MKLLHDEQCTYGNVAFQSKLHLQQTLPLLCPEPYKHPKTTKLNFNTTKEEGDGSLLSLLLFHNTIKEDNDALPLSFSSLTQKEGKGSKLLPSLLEHHQRRK